MHYTYRLNRAPYHNSQIIKVMSKYNKTVGAYMAIAELLEETIIDGSVLYGKVYCPEYYKSDCDYEEFICAAKRQSEKKTKYAEEYIAARSKIIAERYCERLRSYFGNDIKIVEE